MVLTYDRGKVGVAQSAEIITLRRLDVAFKCIDIASFHSCLRPLHVEYTWPYTLAKLQHKSAGWLHWACAKGDHDGCTALHLCAERAAPAAVIDALIAARADPNQCDYMGHTALHHAVILGRRQPNVEETVTALLRHSDPAAGPVRQDSAAGL